MFRPLHELRHPLIFYYGHVAALYVNKLRSAGLVKGPLNAYFEALLETGVDEMTWDDVGDGNMSWPSVEEVHAYRSDVYNLVSKVIASAPEDALSHITVDSPYWALPMSFEHERIHIETSSVLIRELPLEYVSHPATWPKTHPVSTSSPDCCDESLLHVEAGSVTLGKPRDFPSFGWDNEYGSRTFSVPAFEAGKHMVSNGEFAEFVKDAGYARRELWTESGWGWKMFRNVKCPHFWVPEGPTGLHEYRLRTVFEEVALPKSWPVLVNYHEAKAFAKWKTFNDEQALGDEGKAYRISTELEHHLMRGVRSEQPSLENPQAADPILSASSVGRVSNTGLSFSSESPVGAFPPNPLGFHDLMGNAWEWCEDYFSALDGFNISKLYEDFSTPCFDGEHHVIMGGSFASCGNLGSKFARYHFRPHFHQHAGFRLVAPVQREEAEHLITSCTDAPPPYVGSYPFRTSSAGRLDTAEGKSAREAESAFADNMALHFAVPDIAHEDPIVSEGLRYPQRCAQLLVRALEASSPNNRGDFEVVEVGCGAGGGSFELSKSVGNVVALDSSKALIDAASTLARGMAVEVKSPSIRGTAIEHKVSIDADANPSRISFRQCDPMCLPASLAGVDGVLIHSVIDAIPGPNSLLGRMGGARGLVRREGGLVVIVSAYDWNDRVTPRGSWLGGFDDENGDNVSSVLGLSRGLGEDFALIHKGIVPCVRPLADRIFEYSSAEATIWRRD
ncbi:unnamed protein product [Sphacelaria rigidula]